MAIKLNLQKRISARSILKKSHSVYKVQIKKPAEYKRIFFKS